MAKAPTLSDLKRTIPQGGLLNPGYRVVKPFNARELREKLYKRK